MNCTAIAWAILIVGTILGDVLYGMLFTWGFRENWVGVLIGTYSYALLACFAVLAFMGTASFKRLWIRLATTVVELAIGYAIVVALGLHILIGYYGVDTL